MCRSPTRWLHPGAHAHERVAGAAVGDSLLAAAPRWQQKLVLLHDDNTLLRAGAWDGSIHAVNLAVADGRVQQRLCHHHVPARCLALSEDGGTLVAGSDDGTVSMWAITSAFGASLVVLLSSAVTTAWRPADACGLRFDVQVASTNGRLIRNWP